jgi:hypothetical protein
VTTGGLITINDIIAIDGWFDINVDIPKSSLILGEPFMLAIQGYWFNTTSFEPEVGDPAMSAISEYGFLTVLGDLNSTPRWDSYSSKNFTWLTEPPTIQQGWTIEGFMGPTLDPFLELDQGGSSWLNTTDSYKVRFRLKFNSTATPGFYNFIVAALDDNMQSIAESQFSELSGRSVGISLADVISQVTGGFYSWTRVNDDGDPIYSANRGEDFNMTLEITGTNLDNASIFIDLPYLVKIEKAVIGPFIKADTVIGGWEWDNNAKTYFYNSSASTTRYREVHGQYFVDEYLWLDDGFEVEVYDPYQGTNHTERVSYDMAITYNFTSGLFETWLSYEIPYYTGPVGKWRREYNRSYLPYPADHPKSYIINTTESTYVQNDNIHNITFRGHISHDVVPTGPLGDNGYSEPLRLESDVYSQDGKRLAPIAYLPTSSDNDRLAYEALRTLSVEAPVAVVRLQHKGQPYRPDWIFQTDGGETFTVKSFLQGGGNYISDIDGVVFQLEAFEDSWGHGGGFDWNQFTVVHVLTKVYKDGSSTVEVFNHTRRTEWGIGEHYEWQYVEVFSGSGIFEWQQVLVNDFYWKELYWNFLTSDWTEHPVGSFAPEALMSVNYLDVGNASYTVDGDDLRVQFDITPTTQLPHSDYEWQFYFGNLTWVPDYTVEPGEHTVFGWVERPVYSYTDGSRVYVEQPVKSLVMRNNDTDVLYPVTKSPFVILDDEFEPLRLVKETTPEGWVNERLLFEEWDPFGWNPHEQAFTGWWKYWFEFANGTKLEINEGRAGNLWNITLMSGDWFLSHSNIPFPLHDPPGWEYMQAVNGSIIKGDPAFWAGYSEMFLPNDTISLDEVGLVTYANDTIPIVLATWPQWMGDHYMIHINGTWEPYPVFFDGNYDYIFNASSGEFLYFYQGVWPQFYYKGQYQSQDVFVPEMLSHYFAYANVSGTRQQLPHPGAMVWDIYDLEGYTMANAITRVHINNEWHHVQHIGSFSTLSPPIYNYEFFIADVMGTIYNLTLYGTHPLSPWNPDENFPAHPFEFLPWVTMANGSVPILDMKHHDWTMALGHRDPLTWEFVIDQWLDVVTGKVDFDGGGYFGKVFDTNFTAAPPYDYVISDIGEQFFYNQSKRVLFLNVTFLNGTSIYTSQLEPDVKGVRNNVTNEFEPEYYYYYDLNGTPKVYTEFEEVQVELEVVYDLNETQTGFTFQGVNYSIFQFDHFFYDWVMESWENYTQENVWLEEFAFLDMKNGTYYEVIPLPHDHDLQFNMPSFNFTLNGFDWYNVTGRREMIYEKYTIWGDALKLDLAPLPITIRKEQRSVVIGQPRFGMWEVDIWTKDPNTGALDLDGDLTTTDDQYYVRNSFSSSDSINVTEQYMFVDIMWEPDADIYEDEFHLQSFTGMVTFNWSTSWAETHTWYHADSGQILNATEWNKVNSTLFFGNGMPKPGYWGVSWLGANFTSADLKQKAIDEGWEWIPEDTQEWSWLWWELSEDYNTEVSNGTHVDRMSVSLAYEFAGMLAWNDTDNDDLMDIDSASVGSAELTHYWMPVDATSVSFVTPGEGWGNNNASDMEYRAVNETIDFGVSFQNISGIVFPFGELSYWDWYDGQYHGSDLSTFDERPSFANTENFTLAVHFTGTINETGSNIAEVKFDLNVGNWDVDAPGGTSVLDGYSLAIAFSSRVSVRTSGGQNATSTYYDDAGNPLNNTQVVASENYTLGTGLTDVALMSLGGAPYTWARNASLNATVDAQTVPLSTFSTMYVSSGQQSATGFNISSEQFYTLIGFPYWEGYEVDVDPIFVGYVSTGSLDTTAPSIDTIDETGTVDNLRIEITASDVGGSLVAGVKIWDITNNVNYTATWIEADGVWRVDIPRSQPGRYPFTYRVVALDGSGNEGLSDAQLYTFIDNIPPSIDSVSIDNSTDGLGREIAIVTTQVSDTGGSGIASVVLTYSNSSGNFNVPMILDVSDYTGTIPNHAPDTFVDYWVTVTDGDGNSVQSTTQSFHFTPAPGPDTTAPSISSMGHGPDTPTSSDTVTVSATIQDSSGVSSAVLQYRVGTSDWVNVSMTPSGNTYSATIPTFSDGTTVMYRIVAYDTVGNERVSGEGTYTVSDATTTTTTTTTPTTTEPTTSPTGPTEPPVEPSELFQTFMLIGLGLIMAILVLLIMRRRR